jgi:hypothetical protein
MRLTLVTRPAYKRISSADVASSVHTSVDSADVLTLVWLECELCHALDPFVIVDPLSTDICIIAHDLGESSRFVKVSRLESLESVAGVGC